MRIDQLEDSQGQAGVPTGNFVFLRFDDPRSTTYVTDDNFNLTSWSGNAGK